MKKAFEKVQNAFPRCCNPENPVEISKIKYFSLHRVKTEESKKKEITYCISAMKNRLEPTILNTRIAQVLSACQNMVSYGEKTDKVSKCATLSCELQLELSFGFNIIMDCWKLYFRFKL